MSQACPFRAKPERRRRARLLMCPPDYYGIEYEINPWMSRARPANTERARRQWVELHRVLTEEMGATVELVEPRPGLPDLVFTANAGLVSGDLFIEANFRYRERASEAPVFAAWFAERGYHLERLSPNLYFEGEGDILACGDNIFAGYRYRSDVRSHLAVGEILGKRVLSLELRDPRFYHLDTCFFPIHDRAAAYFPAAFDDYGLRVIREHVPELIPVREEEALRFGCNSIVVGDLVVMPTGCPELRAQLQDWGYLVHEVELDEFLKAGGSAKCLVLFLSPSTAVSREG